MSDWQVGDLAVCVDASDLGGVGIYGRLLTEGRAYRVTQVKPNVVWREEGRSGVPAIVVSGVHKPDGGWHASRFRKVRPDEHQACEEEFVTLLKRSRKTVRA